MKKLSTPVKILLAVLLLGASAFYAKQCVRRGNDFRLMWGTWQKALRGGNIYEYVTDVPDATPTAMRNPPFYTFVSCPFGLLPVKASGFAWFYFKLAVLLCAIFAVVRLAGRWRPGRPWAWALPVLLALPWFNNDFTIGHMNLLTSSLTLLALVAWLEDRELPAAVFGSLAICIKGSAAVLVLLYAMRRRWRLCALTVAFCLFWTALPSVGWGPAKTLKFNRDFSSSVNWDTIFNDIDNGFAENWGLPELTMRVLGQAPQPNIYGHTLELAHPSRPVADLIAKGLSGLVMLAMLAWFWFRKDGGKGVDASLAHDAGLAATATLLLSPVSRKAYFGTLLLPYLIVLAYALKAKDEDRPYRAVLALFAGSILAAGLTHVDIVGRAAGNFFARWHALSASLLLLAASQALAAYQASRQS